MKNANSPIPSVNPSTPPSLFRRRRGAIPVAVLYALGVIVAGVTGYKFLTWNPLKSDRVATAASKLEEAEAKFNKATAAAQTAQQAAQQQTVAVASDTKRQTQAAQSMVAATGQVLASAPDAVREEIHVSAALRTNGVAAQALEAAVGKLTPEQITEVQHLVAEAVSSSEAQRAKAVEELAGVKQQLAAEQDDKRRHQQLLRDSEAKLAAAEKAVENAKVTVQKTSAQLEQVVQSHDGIAGDLDRVFFYLKLGLLLYVVFVYVLPLLANVFPGLRSLTDLAHALLAPFAHQEKNGVELLARDASAATDELLELIAQRAPDVLKEAHDRAGAWITEFDGVRARFEQMLKITHRR